MAAEISPVQAGEIASSTYALRLSTDMLDAAVAAPSARDVFDIMGGTRLTGTSGVGPISSSTGFGYVAFGKSGARQGECLVAIRGTEKSSAHDWLTNIRTAGTTGPGGCTVHAGFWALASNILPQVQAALRGRNPSNVHVVGHSLGGATATLVADVLNRNGVGSVRLYTYGAPRAGVELHASDLTQALGRDNIYRVYHHTDPVPMVPVFPFAHVPFESDAYLLRGTGAVLSVDAHLMPTYLRSVGQQAWHQLSLLRPPTLDSFEVADRWLAEVASHTGPNIMLSAGAMRMLLWALRWILRQVGRIAGYAILGAATIIDNIARLLYRGVLASIELANTIENMIAAIMRFAGRTFVRGTRLTVAFLQYVLELMFRMVSTLAMRALNALP